MPLTFDEFRDEAIRLLREDDPKDSVSVDLVQWWYSHSSKLGEKEWRAYSARKSEHWTGSSPEEVIAALEKYMALRRQQRLVNTPEYRREVAEAMGL